MNIQSIFIISCSCSFAGAPAVDEGGCRVRGFLCLCGPRDLHTQCVLNSSLLVTFLYWVTPALLTPHPLWRAASLPCQAENTCPARVGVTLILASGVGWMGRCGHTLSPEKANGESLLDWKGSDPKSERDTQTKETRRERATGRKEEG